MDTEKTGATFRSPYPDVEIPDVTFTELVLSRAEGLGEKPALIDGTSGRALTYAALANGAQRAAAGLYARGFRRGDVLAVYSPNLPEYALAVHATASLGGVITAANPLYTADELAAQLRDSEAKYLLTVPPFLETAREAAVRSNVREVFVFGEAEGATPFAELLGDGGQPPGAAIDPREDLLFLPYSSGTTGMPKGVMLTHHNLVANIAQITTGLDVVREDDTTIAVLPFFHIYGLGPIMNAGLYVGAKTVTLPRFELETFLRTIQDYRVTIAFVVPPIALALARHPLVEDYDLSSLRLVFSGAAPLDDGLARACATRLGCPVRQGFGLTEASPAVLVTPVESSLAKPAAIGPPIANTECAVADPDTGAFLGPYERGELWVRGPQVMKGYLNRPEASAAAITPEGWLRTGDIGYADEEGYLYVVDRLKELIKYKAFQVAPAELEAVLLSHPRVSDAAVVGVPDEESGEIPKAFVVADPEAEAAEIAAFVARKVAPHKKVRALEFVEEIPKSPTGKILRRLLTESSVKQAG